MDYRNQYNTGRRGFFEIVFMDNQAYIHSIAYQLPMSVLSNAQIHQRFPEWSIDDVKKKTGIAERRITKEDEFASDLAVQAAFKLFDSEGIDPQSIDFLIYCTQSPDYYLPATACILQDRLKLPVSCGALDINQGCSGFTYGLALAKGLITSDSARRVLFITSDTYSKYIHPKDKSNVTIFGDGASATLVTADPGKFVILKSEFGTDGSGANHLMVKQGGLRFPSKGDGMSYIDDYGNHKATNKLHMDGLEVFNFSIQTVPSLVYSTVKKGGLSMEDIDWFIFHQANRYMLEHLRKKMQIPESRFVIELENFGNTVSSTIPIALKESEIKGRLVPGQNILLVGFGVGFSWGAMLLKVT